MTPIPRYVSREAVREIDRRAIEEYGIPGIVLMENAGRGAAEFIWQLVAESDDDIAAMEPRAPQRRAAILCGGGNNGGDGLVVARHLSNFGWRCELYFAVDPGALVGDAATNWQIVQRMKLPVRTLLTPAERAEHLPTLVGATVIVDALLGTGARGDPRPPMNEIIRHVNGLGHPRVVALDLPSGLDCDRGTPGVPTIRATHTVTFVEQKIGFRAATAQAYLGRVQVVDIGAPARMLPRG
ncbi:MAG: NAD(P)H-hydrate epimerase [Phycisphaerae bacterium]